jgi:hypothetical protein
MKKSILAIAILLFASGVCSAASTPVDLGDFVDTTWVLYGKNKISISKLGSDSVEGVGYVNFSSDGSTFSVTDTAGYSIYGTYGIDSKDKLFVDVDEDNIQDFFDTYLDDAIGDYVDYYVDATTAKSTCKVKYSGNMISLTITISAKANIEVYYEDDTGDHVYHGKISFSISMSGDHPVAGAPSWASAWDIADAKVSLNAKKIKFKTVTDLELTLGDYGSSGLGLNQYKFVNPGTDVFSSEITHYFCRQKNKILFGNDENGDELASIISNLITSNSDATYDYLEITSGSMTATVKTGTTNKLTLKATIKFSMYAWDYEKERDIVTKGTLTMTGNGVPPP